MKTFTLEEAQALLPLMESLLKRTMDERDKAAAIELQLQEVTRWIAVSGGVMVNVVKIAQQRAEIDEHIKLARETLQEIENIGVQVKDLDAGLLDFPCRFEGEKVLLCWKMGEESITHWHTADTGFHGRQPIDERFKRKSSKPN